MSIVDSILDTIKAKSLERTIENSGLYTALDEIARNLGIPTPKVYCADRMEFPPHPIVHGLVNHPNAASLSKDTIFVSKPMLELFEVDLSKPLGEEFKAILGHEMHHCANRKSMMAMSRFPVLALPAVAVTGMYLYDRAHKKAQEEQDTSPNNLVKHIDATAKEMGGQLKKEQTSSSHIDTQRHEESSFVRDLLHFGKYLAVGVAGLGAGLLAARYGARFHEFAADKFGASVTNNEAMIEGLRKIHKAAGASVSEHPQKEAFQGILAETILAHPNFAERTANIRSR